MGLVTDTVKESAPEVDSGRKKTCRNLGLEPASVLRLAFQSDALPAELFPPRNDTMQCLVFDSSALITISPFSDTIQCLVFDSSPLITISHFSDTIQCLVFDSSPLITISPFSDTMQCLVFDSSPLITISNAMSCLRQSASHASVRHDNDRAPSCAWLELLIGFVLSWVKQTSQIEQLCMVSLTFSSSSSWW